MRFALVLLLVALVATLPGSAAQAAKPSPTGDRPQPGPRTTHIVKADDQIASPQAGTHRAAASAAAMAPFLTRPYWNQHAVTSIFDHCNPDYSHDGRICEENGSVATAANGVDPTFSAGYAVTPGGHDYLYYDGHNGWDLALNYETLLAAAGGTVNLAGCDPFNGGCGAGFGLTVTIDHPNGLTTRYGHMSQIWVSPGQVVTRGQALGVSGNTGASTGPHLHFGVYVTAGWTAIDPWGWEGNYPDPWPYDVGNLWLTGNPQDPVPWAPQSVAAKAGSHSATVSWSPPTFDGGSGVTAYTVTATPGGASVQVPGTQTSVLVAGLTDGTSYTFAVTAANALGSGPASAASNQVVPTTTFQVTNPASSTTTAFTVGWPAAGATGYDVSFSEDSGAYAGWLAGTPAASALFYGLAGHSYRFQVTAHTPTGLASASSGPTQVTAGATTPFSFRAAYTLDQFGALHAVGSQPIDSGPRWNWDIARALAVLPSGDGGYILDGWGGVNRFGNAPPVTITAYWQWWDIARGIALLPDGSGGYVLDGYGGLHPFAVGSHPIPPMPVISGYWNGWDIARSLALTSDGKGGYVLDGYGGIHPFSLAGPPTVWPSPSAYWPGWDIARSITTVPGTSGGFVIDGWGGVHPFGGVAAVGIAGYWPGRDVARSVWAGSLPAAGPGGYEFNADGSCTQFGYAKAPPPCPALAPGARLVAGGGV
jgi:murein DD-endopeptidase MepM/ murein hydrolase activator NlpD